MTSDSSDIPFEGQEPLLPHSIDAEQALLGALLHHNQAFEQIGDLLHPEHFFVPFHRRIFEAIASFIHSGKLADPITLASYFKDDAALQEMEGENYLIQLAGMVVSLANTRDYARQIHEFYLRRQLVHVGEDILENARTHTVGETPIQQIEHIERRLFDLAESGQEGGSVQPFVGALTQAIRTAEVAFKRDSHVVGVTTGLVDMDKQLGGLHPSDLIIIAGRPSMGKTALATNIGFNAAREILKGQAKEGAKVAFFSLEMSAEQLALRLLGQETGISSDRIRRGAISQEHFPRFVDVSRELSNLPFFIDDTPALSISGLRTRARRLQRQEGLGLIIVDYLQLLTTGRKSAGDNRVQELSEITRGLKALAKELNVPVIVGSQLSRAVEQRDDKRPLLADLRESGSIEQDADVVMFIYREEYYLSRKKPAEGSDKMLAWQQGMSEVHNLAEVIIAKQRHGPIGTIQLHFDGMLTKFSNYIQKEKIQHVLSS